MSGSSRTGPRAALTCCLAAGFATLLDATVIAYTAPSVSESLGVATGGVQWFLASYSLTFGLGLVPAGRLGDAFGRRGLFIGGMIVFLLGAIASALAPSVVLLIAGRLLQGVGAGIVSAQVLGVIQDTFHGSARVRALGAYTAAGALAAIIGPLIAGALLWLTPVELGWRFVLLTPVPFTAVAIWLGFRALAPRPHARITTGLDIPGIAILGAIVVVVTLPVIDPGMPLPAITSSIVGAVLLIGALVVWERAYARRGRLPLFAPQLLRSAGFVTGNVVALLWFGSLVAFSTVMTVYFLQQDALTALVIAAAFVPSSFARLLASQFSPRLFERFGPRVVVGGLALEVACLLLVLGATLVSSSWPLFAAAAVIQIALGFAGGIIEPPLRAITLGFAPSNLHGVAASFLQLTQRLSATFFVALATGVLLGFGVGGAITVESLRVAVVICTVAVVLALVAATSRSLHERHPVLPVVSVDAERSIHSGDTDVVTSAERRWSLVQVEWDDARALELREAMDAELGGRYGERFSAFDEETIARFSRDFAVDPATIVATVLVLDENGEHVGHAALRALGDELEVKRVFVRSGVRGAGASRALMGELERIGIQRGATRLILQTGDLQQDAVTLYERIGYTPIAIYPPYVDFDFSLCFEKPLVGTFA